MIYLVLQYFHLPSPDTEDAPTLDTSVNEWLQIQAINCVQFIFKNKIDDCALITYIYMYIHVFRVQKSTTIHQNFG